MATRLAQRLIKEARSGYAEAQLSLGNLYLVGGEGLAASNDAALHWLLLAARGGVADADRLIAEHVALDQAKSQLHECVEACERAAAQGHPAGYCALGDIYASSVSPSFDLGKTQAAYRRAAEAGHVAAARKLGLLLANGSLRDQTNASDEAIQWLQSAADAGDRPAAEALGTLLWRKGDLSATQWLEPEAQVGSLDAMYRLGELLCVQSSPEAAQRGAYWLERAARKGHALALWRYGRLHVKSFGVPGTGLPHSPLQASRLLERAAAAGVPQALWDLARIYEMPRFSRRNHGRAREYLEQAARAGVDGAELELGKRLSRYKNDRNAWIEAGRWLSRAAEKGSREAKDLLERIADRADDWPPDAVHRQDEILKAIRGEQPLVAARLELAARFGLSAREMLFIDALDIDRGWCVEIDLFRHFKRMPWRLVIIESARQRQAVERASEAFFLADGSDQDLTASSTMGRARQLATLCLRMALDPALFVKNWKA